MLELTTGLYFKGRLLALPANIRQSKEGRHDIQHNDTKHNDTQHKDTQHK